MTHASLFSGIGGFDLAAEWIGWDNIFHCEWNPFGQKVLAHHFQNSKSYNDITKTDFSIHAGEIDILTGGFPCQPYSQAGKRLGKADERHLFPHMLRCIKEVKPRWVIGENVRGLVNWNEGMVFNEVYDDLEREGYEVQSFLIPAASVNAPHQRQRIWFVAYCNNEKRFRQNNNNREWNIEKQKSYDRNKLRNNIGSIIESGNVANSKCIRLQHSSKTRQISGEETNAKRKGSESTLSFKTNDNGYKSKWENFPTQSPVCGGDDGLPRELDNITFPKWRKESIKAYGNAIVPQVAYEIFKAIQQFEDVVNV
jgi:DNA (cytosine-5)-methyltransferase 1